MQSEEEQQELQALRANMQRLPADIQPQPASQPTGVCHVCFVEDYTDDNLLLEVGIGHCVSSSTLLVSALPWEATMCALLKTTQMTNCCLRSARVIACLQAGL